MRRLIAFTLAAALCPVGFMGCAEKSSVETKKEVSTPGGTTEVKTETEVKKTGDNPPPATTNP
jgi:hypothetical protein